MRWTLCLPFLAAAAVALLAGVVPAAGKGDTMRLRVSQNRRFLVHDRLPDDGEPFFYLGDTAWEIFHRLTREEAGRYLRQRAELGFTVIQAVALAEFDGHTEPNAYGHLPLIDQDPARPNVVPGLANDYWDHVDAVVRSANELGLWVGFLPTWGRYWHDPVKDGKPLFTPENAEVYGEWLGRRYRDAGLIWILGGDRVVENDTQREVIRAMARGLRRGDGGTHLMTFHPAGGRGSAEVFHTEPWLDFNMRQNGHGCDYERYRNTRLEYDRLPVKPVIDGEPVYEDHPVAFRPDEQGHSISADVRRAFYWDVFSGAFGHTYGHHSVWQMYTAARKPINRPLMEWTEAMEQPGARQMRHGRRLIESRPFLDRVPDDGILVPAASPSSVPGSGRYRFVATRDAARTYAMVYVPIGRRFRVHMDAVKADRAVAWWFDPRSGKATRIGSFSARGEREFLSPSPGEFQDWVLVLDAETAGYPPPGRAPE